MPMQEATRKNLEAAFAGESQANRRYLAYAKKADEEGHPQVAKLFRAAAAAETVHAFNHFRTLGGVKATKENIEAAAEGEHYEFTRMYPEFVRVAESESEKGAAYSFNLANQVEQIHHKLYVEAFEALEEGREMKKGDYYVCQVCGNTVLNDVPDVCPICGSAKEKFTRID
jgi:rubrerythrin